MNTRLDIASRLLAGALADPERALLSTEIEYALIKADELIALEAETRQETKDD